MSQAHLRYCAHCGRPIHGCFGFVLARDWIASTDGQRPARPRELCGKCVFLFENNLEALEHLPEAA